MFEVGDLVDIKPFYTPASVLKSDSPSIPRNFFQTYKTSFFDRQHAEWMRIYRSKHPEYDFIFHDDHDMDKFMFDFWGTHPIYPIFKGAQFGPSKADIWRYCILYTYGGIYLDIDSALLFNLNGIPNDIDELISFEKNEIKTFSWHEGWPCGKYFKNHQMSEPLLYCPDNIVLQWVLGFKKQHSILKRTLELIIQNAPFYANRVFENVLHAVVSFTGPIVYTQAVWEYAQQNLPLSQFGYSINDLAVFKNIPSPKESVYLNNNVHYEFEKNKLVLLLN